MVFCYVDCSIAVDMKHIHQGITEICAKSSSQKMKITMINPHSTCAPFAYSKLNTNYVGIKSNNYILNVALSKYLICRVYVNALHFGRLEIRAFL